MCTSIWGGVEFLLPEDMWLVESEHFSVKDNHDEKMKKREQVIKRMVARGEPIASNQESLL